MLYKLYVAINSGLAPKGHIFELNTFKILIFAISGNVSELFIFFFKSWYLNRETVTTSFNLRSTRFKQFELEISQNIPVFKRFLTFFAKKENLSGGAKKKEEI